MAIYHLNVKIIGRSSGRSSVAAAAYRSGDTLTNNYDGLTHDYSRKGWILHSEIMLPGNAPPSYKDRSTLWNAVESAEKSVNSQLAREIEIAIPHELTLEQQTALIRAYIDKNFVSHGMIADFAIHNPPVTDGYGIPIDADGSQTHDPAKMIFQNPHTHIMLTMRPLNAQGKWQPKSQKCYLCRKDNEEKSIPPPDMEQAKTEGWQKQYQYKVGKKKVWLTEESAARQNLKLISRDPKSEKVQNPITAEWNSKDALFRWRESWASMCNQALKDNNIDQQIDHRSYAAQGINKVGSVHLGVEAFRAEKRGKHTDLGNLNRQIQSDNYFLHNFKVQIEQLEKFETERLHQLSSRLEGLRAQHIAAAYQQIILSTSLADEQDNIQKQAALAGAYTEATSQIIIILSALEQSIEVKYKELAKTNPIQIKKRKSLETEIFDTEGQIQTLKSRLDELKAAYEPDPPVFASDPELFAEKQKRISRLKEIQSKLYKEYYALIDENKDNMEQLRYLIRGKRNTYDSRIEQKLKEHYTDGFQKNILIKAMEGAPEVPEISSAGMKNIISHRR